MNNTMDDSNKITNKALLTKRLRNSGYVIDKLDNLNYKLEDSRKFTILLDNGGNSIFITVYKNGEFNFYDGNRVFGADQTYSFDDIKLKGRKTIKPGFERLVEFLNDNGIVNKHRKYTLTLEE